MINMINKLKIIFWSFCITLLNVELSMAATREVWAKDVKKWLLNVSNDNIVADNQDNGLSVLSSITIWIKNSLSSLVMIIAVWVFLVLWARLAMARWNPEEFKKAVLQLVYAIVWIFIVAIAWAAVTLVAWINL